MQYLDYKGVSQREFTRNCDMSEGVLRRGKNIGSGYLKKIKTKYPDLNMSWVLFDSGEMIIDTKTQKASISSLNDLIDDDDAIFIVRNWGKFIENELFKNKFESEAYKLAYEKSLEFKKKQKE